MSVSNSRIKRFLACALAVVMMVMCWFPTYANAVVLEGAALVTLDLFINVLIIAMLGSEMDGAFRGAAAADDMKPKDWLSLQINKYTNGEGLHEPGLLNMFQAGVKYWQDGTVVIGEQMADWITDFQNWLWGYDEASDSPMMKDFADYIEGSGSVSIDGVDLPFFSCSNLVYGQYRDGEDIVLGDFLISEAMYYSSSNIPRYQNFLWGPSGGGLYLFRVGNDVYGYGSGDYGTASYSNNFSRYTGTKTSNWNNEINRVIGAGTGKTYLNIPNFNILPSVSDIVISPGGGLQGDPDKLNKALLGVAAGAAAAGVAIGLPDSVLIGRDGETLPADATVDIADYVSAVADAAAGVYYPTMPVAIPGEGVLDVPVSIPADTTVPVDGVDDVGVDEATGEAAGDVAGEASGDVTGTGDYTVALSDFFPFCIPFDLLAMLKKFQASAEAPKVDVPITIMGNTTIYTIDFSPWDSAARVLRTMEKIAFAIGLAWATKNLIQGGS